MGKFWWGQKEDERKIHWLKWGKMSEVKADGGLGFRDLHEFNLALLAKQLWRILTMPNLLVSNLMKAKYFKGASIWKIESNGTDSWCWKSLLKAKDLLEEGMRKQVGDGANIHIWEDMWLPDTDDGRVKAREGVEVKAQWVNELIKDGEWDMEMITRIFDEETGRKIFRIPLSVMPMTDRIYWVMSSTGVYTVKSGYKLAKIRKRREEPRRTGAEPGCSVSCATLSSVWHLNIKPKLKHFIWRCLNGILPVNALLMDRCSKGSFLCKCCGENPETIEHLFFFCNNAQEIWKAAPLDWDGLKNFRSKFWLRGEEMKDAVREEKGRERIELTVHLLWQIWKSRNGMQFKDKRREPMAAISKAVLEWREYMEAQEVKEEVGGDGRRNTEDICSWRGPKEDWIKINSDAALDQEGDKAGWGLIARDWQGEVKGAWAVPSPSCSHAKMEEAKALRHAMLVAKRNGWSRVEFESDCLQVVNDINSKNDEAIRCTVISDIRKLSCCFDECCFAFTKRENNSVSHTLARKALQMDYPAEWKESFPGWLLELAHADCKGSCPFFL